MNVGNMAGLRERRELEVREEGWGRNKRLEYRDTGRRR